MKLKKLVVAILVCSLFFLSGCSKESDEKPEVEIPRTAEQLKTGKIIGNNVNCRSGPSVENKVKFQLSKGDEVKILAMEAEESMDEFKRCEWVDDGKGNYSPPYGFKDAILTSAYKLDEYTTLGKGMGVRVCFSYDPGGHGWVHIEYVAEGKVDTFGLHDEAMVRFEEICKSAAGTPWYKIRTADEQTGWVYGEFLEPQKTTK